MISAITCLAMAVYFEARSEPVAGQLAVAQVVLNRVDDKRYPNTVCEVVKEGPLYKSGHPKRHMCQFSFWCDGKPETITNHSAWQTALQVAAATWDTSCYPIDVSGGATHYHTTEVSPQWRYTMQMTVQIGRHLFYRGEK